MARVRLAQQAPSSEEPKLLAALDAFENRWFQVSRAALEHRHPRMAALLFLNLSQASGASVALTVQMFLERLADMAAGEADYGQEGVEARALLDQRGLTNERVAEAQTLLDRLGELQAMAQAPAVDPDKAAEQALWSWYLEWSRIARAVIRDKRLLRALGFRKTARSGEGATPEQDIDATTPSDTVAVLEPPAPRQLTASSPTLAGSHA